MGWLEGWLRTRALCCTLSCTIGWVANSFSSNMVCSVDVRGGCDSFVAI
jgi:hypothetical protein